MAKKLIVLGLIIIFLLLGLLSFEIFLREKAPARKKESVVVATSTGGAIGFASEVLKREKLDLKNGVEIELRYFSPADAEMALFNRVVEMGYFAPISAVKAESEGKHIRIIGPALWNHYSILIKNDSKITNVDELKGKKFGSLDRYTGGYTNLAVIMATRGEDIEKYFKIIVGQPNMLIALLERGDVDAIMMYEPLASKLISKGMAKKLISMQELWEKEFPDKPLLLLGFAAHEDWLEKNKEKAKRVVSAYLDAYKYIKENPSIIRESWAKEILGIESEEEKAILMKTLPEVYPDEWSDDVIEGAEFLLKKSFELGLIKSLPKERIFIKLV